MLKPYMGFDRQVGPEEGACLVFAHSAKEARSLAHYFVSSWGGEHWFDTAIRRMWKKPWIFEEGDAAKLAADIAHVIESPRSCQTCGQWGLEQKDGVCTNCLEPTVYG